MIAKISSNEESQFVEMSEENFYEFQRLCLILYNIHLWIEDATEYCKVNRIIVRDKL